MNTFALPHVDAPIPAAYRPRLRIAPAAAELINRLERPRAPFAATIEGLSLRLAPEGVALGAPAEVAGGVAIVFSVAEDTRVALVVPSAVLDRVAQAIQPELESLPQGQAGRLLLELALAPLLDAAEHRVGRTLRIEAIEPPPHGLGRASLVLDAALDGQSFPAQIDLGSSAALSIRSSGPAAILRLVETALPRHASVAAIPLALVLVAGTTSLSLARLRRLRVGDAVLPDTWHPHREEVVVVLGERFAAPATTDRHTTRLKAPLRPIAQESTGAVGEAGMAQDTVPEEASGAAAGTQESGLDAVSVTMRFELGRRIVAIGELKGIGAGHVFDLGLDPAEPVEVTVNGASVGRGEIVAIGERLGIRMVRLYGRD